MTQTEALRIALEAMEMFCEHGAILRPIETRDAIKAALEAKDEPKCVAIVEVFEKDWRLDYMALPVGKHKLYAQQYTYTTPSQRKPLTDEEISAIDWKSNETLHDFARAIEAAHGIKGET